MLDPLIGTGLEVAGGLFSGLFGQSSAREQMRFQERMSSTAHQREVADLRAAGLNPVLSAMHGAGASTPTGASSTMPNPAAGAAGAFSARAALQREQDRLDSIDKPVASATQAKLRSEANLADETAQTEAFKRAHLAAGADALTAQRALDAARTLTQEHLTDKAYWDAKLSKADFDYYIVKGGLAAILTTLLIRTAQGITANVKDATHFLQGMNVPAQLGAAVTDTWDRIKAAASKIASGFSSAKGTPAADLPTKALR